METSESTKSVFAKLLEEVPKTLKMPRYISATANFVEQSIKQCEYASYEALAVHLGLKNARHRSVSKALLALVIEDVINDKPWRTSIVVGKSSGTPGQGYFELLRIAGIPPEQESIAWQEELKNLGYQSLPKGERIPQLDSAGAASEPMELVISLDEKSANDVMSIAKARGISQSEAASDLVKLGLEISRQSRKMLFK